MRHVIFTDDRGYKHRMLVRDADPDEAASSGVPAGPPDLNEIDWDYAKREINNALVDNGLFTWKDVQASPIGLMVIATVIKRHFSAIFHEAEKRERSRKIQEQSQNKVKRK